MRNGRNVSEEDCQEHLVPAISLRSYSLAYKSIRGSAPLQVLQDVSLSVRPGEIITIIGPSGCGKTTFLRAISGLLTAEDDGVICDGLIEIFGLSPFEAKRRRFFAFAFQNPVLLPWRTVHQNVGLPLEVMNNRKIHADVSVVSEMLSMVGISEFAGAMPSEISGGMQQRANLARALVQEPRILLMDEPFGSLDEITRERLNFELLRIHRVKKPTILFITHSLSEATLLADRVIVLSQRPATVRASITIDLPPERTEETILSSQYLQQVRNVRREFEREESGI